MGKRTCHFAGCCHVPSRGAVLFCDPRPRVMCECAFSSQPHQEKLLSNCGVYTHLMGEKWSLSAVWICTSNWYLPFLPATAHSKFPSPSGCLPRGWPRPLSTRDLSPSWPCLCQTKDASVAQAVFLLSAEALRCVLGNLSSRHSPFCPTKRQQPCLFVTIRVDNILPPSQTHFCLLHPWYRDPKVIRWLL